MSRSLRVLWLVKGLGRGGAETLLLGLARNLDRSAVEPQVAYVLPHKDELVAELAAVDVPARCLSRRSRDVGWAQALRRLVREQRIDVVHTHSPVPAVVARAALWRHPVPFVHTEHNVWPRYHPATRALNALTLRRNAYVIAVSEAVAASLPTSGPPVETIVHGVDRDRFRNGAEHRRAARQALGLPETACVIGTVGHLTPKKGHARLLEATAELAPRHPALRTVIVGRGPLEQALRAQARALGIEEQVVFAGLRADVPDILPAFDVFVLPSLFEGLPISLLEAMAASIPVVATAVGGIPEVIRSGSDGVLVNGDDPSALVRAIGSLLDDSAERARLGLAGRARAELFDLSAATARTAAVYADVVGRS